MLKILLLSSALLFSFSSQACLGPQYEDYVLLDSLPATANEKSIVAKVKLLANTNRVGRVRVIEAIKGVVEGQEFEVQAGRKSCSHLESRIRFTDYMDESEKANVTDIYYLAGEWRQEMGKQVFVGEWRDHKWFPIRLQKLLNSYK